jgi:hypothetical protein
MSERQDALRAGEGKQWENVGVGARGSIVFDTRLMHRSPKEQTRIPLPLLYLLAADTLSRPRKSV